MYDHEYDFDRCGTDGEWCIDTGDPEIPRITYDIQPLISGVRIRTRCNGDDFVLLVERALTPDELTSITALISTKQAG